MEATAHIPVDFRAASDTAGLCLILAPEKLLTQDGVRQGYGAAVRDGKFLKVDALDAVRQAHPELKVLNLPGKLLMPGFVDSHQHLAQAFGKALAFGEPSEIFKRVWIPLEGFLTDELVYLSGKLAALEALRGGITTLCDAGARSGNDLATLAQSVTEVGARCVLGYICNDSNAEGVEGDARRKDILQQAQAHLSRFDGNGLVTPSLAVSIPEAASNSLLQSVYKLCEESGRIFQTHVNEHLAAVERSIIARKLRPLEHLAAAGALGPATLAAHVTLVTPAELTLLARSGAAVSYCPVASQWKGNAVAPALQMHELGVRLGLGTDGTRSDGFRLMDAAEASQRLTTGLAVGDFSCGAGSLWLDMATRGGANTVGLGQVTGSIAAGLEADFLLVDLQVPEFTPSWDLPWDLIRFGNRSQIEAVFVHGRMRLWQGWPTDWDAHAMMRRINERAASVVAQAPIVRVHGTCVDYLARHQALYD